MKIADPVKYLSSCKEHKKNPNIQSFLFPNVKQCSDNYQIKFKK